MAAPPSLLDPQADARLVTWIRRTGALTGILLAVAIVMAWHFAPLLPDCDVTASANCQTSPHAQKLFYFHVPVAFGAYAALTGLAVASYRHLGDRRATTDAFSIASAEVGVLFSALTLISGSIWGRAEWGVWWRNEDTKLVLTLVLFLVYVGYLVLRQQITDPRKRGRIAAVYALLGFVTVPLSYIAQRVWKSQHPTVFDPTNPQSGLVTPWVEETFVVATLAFLALTAYLVLLRFRIETYRRPIDQRGNAE